MYVPYHHPSSFRSANSSRASGRDDHDPYSQHRCQLCEERSATLHNLRVPGHNAPMQVCRPCHDGAYRTQQQRNSSTNTNSQASRPNDGHARSRSWVQRAFGRVQGNPTLGTASNQQTTRGQSHSSSQAQATSISRNESEETLAAAGRESYPDQLRDLRALARGPVDDVQGNLSGATLTERGQQRARREHDGTPTGATAMHQQEEQGRWPTGQFFYMGF